MKIKKTMIGGKYLKVNGKHIMSIGHFAYDGCHKIYVLESFEDAKTAMEYGYYLYPIEKIRDTYEDACPLKFISNFSLNKRYVKQCCVAKWSEAKATKKEIESYLTNV